MSKNRLAPVKKMSIDQIELCGVVLNKGLKQLIEKESRYRSAKCYHIVDSEIVHAMVHKESYGFNTFAAICVGEIQSGTNTEDWYWIASQQNIADWLTRGKRPEEIDGNSPWQKGPDFLRLSEAEWLLSRECNVQELPQQVSMVMMTEVKPQDSSKYSSYLKLI